MIILINKFAYVLTRKPTIVVIVAVMLLIPSLFGFINTKVNYDILSYLPSNLDSTKGQNELEDIFHNAANSMLIIENMPSKDIIKLKEEIKNIDGINDAIWIDDLVDITIPPEILPSKLKDVFYSKNSTMIFVKYDNSSSSTETMNSIDNVRKLLNKQCFLSGMSVIIKDTKDLADHEIPIYVSLAVILSLIAMMLSIESWVLPFLFMFDIFLAVAYNFGTNIFLGQISYVTESIAAILQLGVTMDYSIFLIDRYNEEKSKFDDRRDAMAKAIQSTFVSISGSSMTTIAGFMALCFMELTLGKDIGIVMMKGVILGAITVVTVLPSLILQFDNLIHKYTHRTFIPEFDKLNDFIIKNKTIAAIICIVIFIPAFYSKSNTGVYYNLDKTLPKDLDSIVATNKLKDDFNMASTHFLIVDDNIQAHKMKEMVSKIKNIDGIENVIAYNEIIGPVVPESFIPQEIKDVCKKDGRQLIMINSKYKAALDEENQQVDELVNIVKSYDKSAYLTGEGPLTKDLIEIADHDFKVTNYISIISIFIIVCIVFKSISVPIILVAIIELAIFINLGIPYFTGTSIPFISPTVIGCVQLGATVDYAILMTTRFQEELRRGHDKVTAIQIAANTSDKSIVTSALVFFCATFGVSIISKIEIIKSICTMLARGAIISAVVIIFLLSPILIMSEKLISKTSFKWSEKVNSLDINNV